jgi:pimeloyl-ACP methyl ester carboxylesterase
MGGETRRNGAHTGWRRNGVYSGWTHAGNHRVYVRVPTALKERAMSTNGEGPDYGDSPIVLVHGIATSSRSLKPLIRALGEERAVFAPDLPGFGLSDDPIHPLDVPGLAEALRRWMLDNRVAPAVVVGVSFGCQVAVDLAATYPVLAKKLVLIGPTIDPEGRDQLRLAGRLARGAIFASPRIAPHVLHDWIDAGPWRIARSLRLALQDRIETKLPEVEAPTLVVRGRHDAVVPRSWAKRVTELLPDAELVTVPGGHGPGPRAAAGLAPLVERFITGEEPATATAREAKTEAV